MNPSHIKAYTRLAAVYQKTHREEDAIHICQEGLKIDPNSVELQALLAKLQASHPTGPSGIPSGIPSDPAAAAATGAPSNMGGFASMLNSIAQDPSIREAAQGFANGDMGGLSGLLNNPAISQM